MEAATNAQNEEWQTQFRESQGVMTKEMKKLRTEIALGRETLDAFDDLLAEQEKESSFLPFEIAELAGVSRSAVYNVLAGKRSNLAICDAIIVVLEEEVSRTREFEEKVNGLLS